MKKLVSVLGSIMMGVNVGAVSSNATCVSIRPHAQIESKIFDEIMRKYYADVDFSKDSGWKPAEKYTKQELKCAFRQKVKDLTEKVEISNFIPKNTKYSELKATLKRVLDKALPLTCYVVSDNLKKEGLWPCVKEYYEVLENERNVKLVEENLPIFLKKLSAYLDLKDSEERSALKKEMQGLLNGLPDLLSELIVAALNIYNIKL